MKSAPLLTVLMVLCGTGSVRAQWPADPGVNLPICTAINSQNVPTLIGNAAGGAIVAWYDDRDSATTGADIYAQEVNAAGLVQWPANGVVICTAANKQDLPVIVSDEAGGAIIAWEDRRSGTNDDVYAQKVNADGVVQWTADGVAICTATGDQLLPAIASDGAGGAVITWEDHRGGAADVYAQRIDARGAVRWTQNGVAVCTAGNSQSVSRIVSDGAGGTIITWQDRRNGSNDDIYAQRVDAAGTLQWAPGGVTICTAANVQALPAIVGDGAGGAIITWKDLRSGTHDEIYAQKVNLAGSVQWETDGIAVCATISPKDSPAIAGDSAGGAIITWDEIRGSTNYDIFAQKVGAAGVVQWTATGAAICTAASLQLVPAIAGDGAGGAIITWNDLRGGRAYDIYAQRVNAAGTAQWAADGAPISTATGVQALPAIVPDGTGGAIIAWEDYRGEAKSDVFAQRVLQNGSLESATGVKHDGEPVPGAFALEQNYPNPFNPTTLINYALPTDGHATLTVFNLLGQKVRTILEGNETAGTGSVRFDAGNLPSGLYFYRLEAGTLSQTRKLILAK